MDDTLGLKANPRRKRLIGLGLALLACWALYQWYYIPYGCSNSSKSVWVYTKPKRYATINPYSPKFLLLRFSTSYLTQNRLPFEMLGGHFDFVNLHVNREDSSPYCLRNNIEVTGTNSPALKNGYDLIDGYDIQRLDVSINSYHGLSRFFEPLSRMKFVGKAHGLNIYTMKEASIYGNDDIYFSEDNTSAPLKRGISCARSSNFDNRHTLCSGFVEHKDLIIGYNFHHAMLAEWRELEKQSIAFIDSLIIVRY